MPRRVTHNPRPSCKMARAIRREPRFTLLTLVAVLVFVQLLPMRSATEDAAKNSKAPEELTKAAQVLALPAEQAFRAIPVRVKGVVTVAEKYWTGRFFVQDDSGGVFVDNVSTNQPRPGDVVEVRGISSPGAFAPVILKPKWEKLGTNSLPPPRPVSVERLMSGAEDSQRVQVTGIVRSVRKEHGLHMVDLASGGYRFHVFANVRLATYPS